MPELSSLLPLREAYEIDDDYLDFIESSLAPAMSSLALAIHKDIVWKPMNHKILLTCRDPRSCVRVAAVGTLHKIFSEVFHFKLFSLTPQILFIYNMLWL
jgi:hypothetical protein